MPHTGIESAAEQRWLAGYKKIMGMILRIIKYFNINEKSKI